MPRHCLPLPPSIEAMEGSMLSRHFHGNELILNYSKALRKARWAARLVGFLHILSTFLGFCSLTWASVVLLGAFASALNFADFSSVTALLLVEAARLACATFFTHLLTHSPDPGHLIQAAFCTPDHFRHPQRFRVLFPILQAPLIAPSFVLASIRLFHVHSYKSGSIDHLQFSLRIFYVLVTLNATVSAFSVFSSFMASIRLKDPSEHSILRYYDEVLRNILAKGLLHANDFNFFQYAFKILGREHARYNSWQTVVEGYRKLLTYIYAHKQGADYLQIFLGSEDASVRQAAANMVGMWADEKRGLQLIVKENRGQQLEQKRDLLDLPPELLVKLADMVGTGEVGWAATNSFGALAKRNPEFLVQTLTSSKEPVLHKIASLVNGSSTRSLASVRTLVLFYNEIFLRRSAAASHEACLTDTPVPAIAEMAGAQMSGVTRDLQVLPKDMEVELVRKLNHLLRYSEVQRLRVQSAYLLYLLGKLDRAGWDLITDIDPELDTYWYEMEKKMLEFFLRNRVHTPLAYPPHVWPDFEVIYEGEPGLF